MCFCSSEETSRTCKILKGFTLISVIAIVITVIYCVNQVEAKPSTMSHLSSHNSPWKVTKFGDKFNPIAVLDTKTDQIIFVTGSLSPYYPVIVKTPKTECSIELNLRYNSISRRTATNLGNGKIIATLKNNKVSRDDPTLAAEYIDWKLIIVDPVNDNNLCTNINLTIGNADIHFIQIVPHQDTFDILIENTYFTIDEHSLEGPIQVIRANGKGELTRNFARIPDKDISKVVLAKKYDPSQGYYYIASSGDKKSLIKKLDSKYKIVNSYEFELSQYNRFDKNSFSAEHGQFSICYYDDDYKRNSLKCLIMNADLTKKLVEIPLTFDQDVEHVTVNNYADGTVLVVYARGNDENREYLLTAQLIGKDGKIGGSVDLGNAPDVIYEISSFEIKDGSYCLAVTTDGQIMTKCLG